MKLENVELLTSTSTEHRAQHLKLISVFSFIGILLFGCLLIVLFDNFNLRGSLFYLLLVSTGFFLLARLELHKNKKNEQRKQ